MIPVYIAGPYRADTIEGVERHVRRAAMLANLAARLGMLPVLPHAPGFLGVYGGNHDDAAADDLAIACGLGLLDMVAERRGLLWVIAKGRNKKPSGAYAYTWSSGCQTEANRWRQHEGAHKPSVRTWDEWLEFMAIPC